MKGPYTLRYSFLLHVHTYLVLVIMRYKNKKHYTWAQLTLNLNS